MPPGAGVRRLKDSRIWAEGEILAKASRKGESLSPTGVRMKDSSAEAEESLQGPAKEEATDVGQKFGFSVYLTRSSSAYAAHIHTRSIPALKAPQPGEPFQSLLPVFLYTHTHTLEPSGSCRLCVQETPPSSVIQGGYCYMQRRQGTHSQGAT